MCNKTRPDFSRKCFDCESVQSNCNCTFALINLPSWQRTIRQGFQRFLSNLIPIFCERRSSPAWLSGEISRSTRGTCAVRDETHPNHPGCNASPGRLDSLPPRVRWAPSLVGQRCPSRRELTALGVPPSGKHSLPQDIGELTHCCSLIWPTSGWNLGIDRIARASFQFQVWTSDDTWKYDIIILLQIMYKEFSFTIYNVKFHRMSPTCRDNRS